MICLSISCCVPPCCWRSFCLLPPFLASPPAPPLLLSLPSLAVCALPHGVHPDLSAHYQASSSFHCLDGSGAIPWDQLNDDYCDCKVCKGSKEAWPGFMVFC